MYPSGVNASESAATAKKNRLWSTDAVTSMVASGVYASPVTAALCGLATAASFHSSAHRSSTRTTPSPKPTATRRLANTHHKGKAG
jgi:hypothetical protein